ncbi:GrBNV_gp33-like protein [Drosophila innubila nudivirus]|uniref:GrBNV_gp33-like protein n=1 Tax=Drosophila innubila nudivirus TaxID=2057187 RepID=A0A2H4UXC2_9VIRU|nr:GrBNV_gp33-like protein [Drosophila innubila nudivirus]ATZ81565.1 GrBNV_gp33-like protein [Drosophila innubila nudivirus]
MSALKMIKNKNLPSICVFLYNCNNGIHCELMSNNKKQDANVLLDIPNISNFNKESSKIVTFENLTPLDNTTALMNGYIVDEKLMALSRIDLNISLPDFGITILMMFFAEFYSKGQYPLYMNTFRCIKELEIIERFLLAYNQRSIKLPMNLATHKIYGIKTQREKFINTGSLTISNFNNINNLMRAPSITPEQFIESISKLDLSIIESFYIFTSITKNCKIINECHDLQHNSMPYTFQKPVQSLRYDGDYWFVLPRNAIWFAYFQGRVKYSSYVSCDINEKLKCFKVANVMCVVVGFIHDNCVYPIIFDDPRIYANWALTINYIINMKFNCILNPNTVTMPTKQSQIHFVKQNVATIFKLIPS